MTDQPQKPQGVPINTGDEMSRGRYSNQMIVTHSPEEFIIDWLLNSPSGIHLISRVIVSPSHLKKIISALTDNLQKHEQSFGPVRVIEPTDQTFH
jgi:hypothetical protein